MSEAGRGVLPASKLVEGYGPCLCAARLGTPTSAFSSPLLVTSRWMAIALYWLTAPLILLLNPPQGHLACHHIPLPPPRLSLPSPPSLQPAPSPPVAALTTLAATCRLPACCCPHRRARGGGPLPVLTSKLQLYDDDANPYNPILGSWAEAS